MAKARLVKPFPFPTDFGTVNIDFDPGEHATAEAAAKAFYAALCKFADECGYDSKLEVWIKNPAEAGPPGWGVKAWWVCWASGPYDWGVITSMTGLFNRKAGWWTEPYWGFDVAFYQDAPWPQAELDKLERGY